MEAVLGWMKGLVILFVVMAALLHLVPKEQYKKYIRFFMELVVVIAVIQPVSRVVYASEDFDEKIHYSQFLQEMENMKKDVEKMDFLQNDYHKEEYETAIEEDIRQMAEGREYEVSGIDAVLSDDYELESVSLTLKRAAGEETGDWRVEDISIGDTTAGGSLAQKTLLESGARELKQEIESFYQLQEEQITIRLEE